MTRAETLEKAKACVCGQREQDYEEWRDIPNEPNYQVSNNGRVKSCFRVITRNNGREQTVKERILKASFDEWGYPQVGLNGHTYKVHRLVALAFFPQKVGAEEIRHLDGNPQNNSIENLAYGTHSQNVLDEYDYRGKLRHNQKLSLNDVMDIKTLINLGYKNRDISMMYGVSEQTICDIKHGRIYSHCEV